MLKKKYILVFDKVSHAAKEMRLIRNDKVLLECKFLFQICLMFNITESISILILDMAGCGLCLFYKNLYQTEKIRSWFVESKKKYKGR